MDVKSIEFIQDRMSPEELLAQLAEEATELAHAALKLRRAFGCTNPTPVPLDEAKANLAEEVADVDLLLTVLWSELSPQLSKCRGLMDVKLMRWVARLKSADPGPGSWGDEKTESGLLEVDD